MLALGAQQVRTRREGPMAWLQQKHANSRTVTWRPMPEPDVCPRCQAPTERLDTQWGGVACLNGDWQQPASTREDCVGYVVRWREGGRVKTRYFRGRESLADAAAYKTALDGDVPGKVAGEKTLEEYV